MLYRNYHSQIIPIKEYNGHEIEDSGTDDLNVMVIMLESISRLTWLRHSPEIHEFITQELGGAILNGHHVVGGNSFPNNYAVMRGLEVYSDLRKLLMGGVEGIEIILMDFAKKGYATLLAEDFLPGKIPSYAKIKKIPVPHHDRASRVLRRSKDQYIPKGPDLNYCYGEKNIFNYTLNQVFDFSQKYRSLGKKFMAYSAIETGLHSHHSQNGISQDKHMVMNFLKKLHASGIINNTVVFIGGDHGCRFKDYFNTRVGYYETSLPLMYGIFPKWFREKYPTAFGNFKFNGENRLTSQYDLYYTLRAILNKDFINPRSHYDPNSHYGVNLLARVPEERTCQQAGVGPHFCMCGRKTRLDNTDPRALKAGQILITKVNELLKDTPCVQYDKFDVIEAYLVYPNEDITIAIETKPVYASMRTTLSLTEGHVTLRHIDRLERYSLVTKCMNENTAKLQDLEMMKIWACVCKDSVWRATKQRLNDWS